MHRRPCDGVPGEWPRGWSRRDLGPRLAGDILIWRHQLQGLGSRGWRVIGPDLRGTGGSTVYGRHEEYALRHHVGDMVALVDALSIDRAIWIGHDWGAPVVWTTARHHPQRFQAVGSLST